MADGNELQSMYNCYSYIGSSYDMHALNLSIARKLEWIECQIPYFKLLAIASYIYRNIELSLHYKRL